MIILGRSHNKKNQGAQTADGLITEWQVSAKMNRAIAKRFEPSEVIQLEGTLGQRIATIRNLSTISDMFINCAIEVHCNASSNPEDQGFFAMAGVDHPLSIPLGIYITNCIKEAYPRRKNKGVCIVSPDPINKGRRIRWRGTDKEYDNSPKLGFLEGVKCPSVIIETCYLTNKYELKYIKQQDNVDILGKAIALGIQKFISSLSKKPLSGCTSNPHRSCGND